MHPELGYKGPGRSPVLGAAHNRTNESAEIMFEPFKVTSWAGARAGCPMKHSVSDSNEVEFTFGSGPHSFDFIFDAGALRKLLKLGAEALREMAERAVLETAGEAAESGVRDNVEHTNGALDAELVSNGDRLA
jgi:hypothetical protein